jgi:hypothetical protein
MNKFEVPYLKVINSGTVYPFLYECEQTTLLKNLKVLNEGHRGLETRKQSLYLAEKIMKLAYRVRQNYITIQEFESIVKKDELLSKYVDFS